jgi:MFS family permease
MPVTTIDAKTALIVVDLQRGVVNSPFYPPDQQCLRALLRVGRCLPAASLGTFGLNFPIFISTMAVKVFHSDAKGFGLLSSIMAVGTISGALLAAGRDKPQFGSLFIGAAVFGIGCTLAALSPGYWWLVLIGVAALTLTNTSNSMMQLSAGPAMRGRVMALRLAVALGGTPIGAPIVGWVANHFGPRWALGVGAASGFAAAIVAVRVLTQRTESIPENEPRPI